VLERAVPGAEASSAAAGILGAQIEAKADSPMLDTFLRARSEYAAWARELRESTGIDVGYRVSGLLKVAFDEGQQRTLSGEAEWQKKRGLRAEWLDAVRALEIEPMLGARVRGAAYFPDESQVDPRALLRALVAAVQRSGATLRGGATVERLLIEREACVGVALDDGAVRADATVLAAGSWSSLVPGVPAEVPRVRPVRGQVVQLDERPPRVRTIIDGAGAYLVPRGDGRIFCGSTLEHAGFRREVTAGGVHAILHGALECVPSLEGAAVTETWCNFRPYLGEGLEETPLVGRSPVKGLFLATGHHRNGILLAKVTAEAVADAVLV
jgi:glycine oxidase